MTADRTAVIVKATPARAFAWATTEATLQANRRAAHALWVAHRAFDTINDTYALRGDLRLPGVVIAGLTDDEIDAAINL